MVRRGLFQRVTAIRKNRTFAKPFKFETNCRARSTSRISPRRRRDSRSARAWMVFAICPVCAISLSNCHCRWRSAAVLGRDFVTPHLYPHRAYPSIGSCLSVRCVSSCDPNRSARGGDKTVWRSAHEAIGGKGENNFAGGRISHALAGALSLYGQVMP